MNAIVLATRRRWNWKVFLLLAGLIFPAQFLILPFEFSRQAAFGGGAGTAPVAWETLAIDRLINSVIIAILGALGLIISNRIGYGMPFLEGWIKRTAVAYRFRSAVAMAWIVAVGLVLSSFLVRTVVFDPPLSAMYKELGIVIPQGASALPLYGLLAWLRGLLFHEQDGRPKALVLRAGNLLFALAFGAGHLPTAANPGLPVNALVIGSTLFGNGIAGLAFGWLSWKFGLESAMLSHFFADVIVYTLIPVITVQDAGTARYLATAGVAAFMLLALFWACRCLVMQSRVQTTPTTY